MVNVFEVTARSLDFLRVRTLRKTLSNESVRRLFCSRPRRLFFLFSVFCAGTFTLSLFFPLGVLMLGPVIYGIPHLFASVRYTGRTLSTHLSKRTNTGIFRFLFFVAAVTSISRILTDIFLIDTAYFNSASAYPEVLTLCFSFLGFSYLNRHQPKAIVLGTIPVIAVSALSWLFPAEVTGFLLLAHNFVAFGYWILSAKTRRDRQVAYIATAVFSALNILVFAGVFDVFLSLSSSALNLSAVGLDFKSIGSGIFPWSANPMLFLHGVIAYAFGQSLHYFVWMKAIPDEHHSHEVPTTFRQSYALLGNDFGKMTAVLALSLTVISLVGWLLVTYPQARMIYFSLAAFHGYMEIAGLGLAIGLNPKLAKAR